MRTTWAEFSTQSTTLAGGSPGVAVGGGEGFGVSDFLGEGAEFLGRRGRGLRRILKLKTLRSWREHSRRISESDSESPFPNALPFFCYRSDPIDVWLLQFEIKNWFSLVTLAIMIILLIILKFIEITECTLSFIFPLLGCLAKLNGPINTECMVVMVPYCTVLVTI